MKWRATLALLATVVATGVVASQAAAAATWTVDDDFAGGQCNATFHKCKTISLAVTKAAAGDTILVYPGQYNDSVTVNKKLTTTAQTTAPDTGSCDDNRTDPDPAVYAVVEPPAGFAAFDVVASGVTINGFILQGATNNAALRTSASFSGYTIRNNLFQDNTIGLYLNSNGTATVSANCFRDNNQPGGGSGDGIYSDLGLKSATVSQNHFFDNTSDDIVLTGTVNPAVQTVTISGNISSESAGFLTFLVSKGVTVSGNIIKNATDGSANESAAILAWGANTMFAIKNNIIQDGAGSGIVFSVLDCCGPTYDMPNSTGTVSNNIVNRNGHDGLYADAGTAASNSLRATTVNNNIFDSNGDDGIHVAKQTLAPTKPFNTFTGNIASNNPVHDCHDNNNKDVWTGLTNLGHRVNKAGLCFPGDVVTGPQNHPPM